MMDTNREKMQHDQCKGKGCADCNWRGDIFMNGDKLRSKPMKGTITWLPIEDAPRDGTKVLLRSLDKDKKISEYGVGYYCQSDFDKRKRGWMIHKSRNQEIYFPVGSTTHFAYINPPTEDNDG